MFCLAAANELKSFRNMPSSEILAEFLRLIFLVIAGRLFHCNEISFSDVFAKAKRRGGFPFPRCLFALRQKQTETILNIFSAASSSKWKTTTFCAVDMMLISKRQKLFSNMMHVINKPRRKREWWESLQQFREIISVEDSFWRFLPSVDNRDLQQRKEKFRLKLWRS